MATKQSSVSKTESMVLIKNMIRISISSICYFRDIFPSDCFKNKQYGAVNIHQLQGATKDPSTKELQVTNKEAFLLTQWLEKGVFEALEAEYLSCILFAIFTKHPKTEADLLLESYEFKISYSEGGMGARVNNVELHSKEAVKNQAAKLIRSLTDFTSTLDTLPPDRWLTIQLKYFDHTPADYEPQFFGPAGMSLLQGLKLPLVINVGHLETSDMDLKLKYAGLESLLYEDICKVDLPVTSKPGVLRALLNSNQEDSLRTTLLCAEPTHPAEVLQKLGAKNEAELSEGIQQMDVSTDADTTQLPDSHAEVQSGTKQLVKSFIQSEQCPVISKCVAKLKLDLEQTRKIFQQLVEDGFLKQVGRSYSIAAPVSIVSDNSFGKQECQDEEISQVEGHSTSMAGCTTGSSGLRKPLPLSTTGQQPGGVGGGEPRGRLHSNKRMNMAISQESELELQHNKRRKYSLVRDPIYQGSAKRRAAS